MMAPHAWAAGPRKRAREDDYADAAMGGASGFSEHRTKRQQTLPVRTSPNAKRWLSTPSFAQENPQPAVSGYQYYGAPEPSEYHEPEVREQHVWAAEPELPSNYSPDSMDMEMMDCEPEPPRYQGQEHHHQQYLQPGSFQPDHLAPEPSISGRIPTPIHCSFAEQVRGKHWGGAAGNITMDHRGSYGVPPPTQQHEPSVSLMGHESVPRSLDGAAATAQVMEDWSMVQNRRLPSPISEVGGEDSGMSESPRMILESYHPGHQHHHDHHDHHDHHHHEDHPLPRQRLSSLDQLTHSHPLLSAMPLRNSSLNSQMGPREPTPIPQGECGSHGYGMDVEIGSPQTSPKTVSPPNKRGHQRSKHTVSSWTMPNQPGMKRSFSIGYRDDCEKCRMKVPGHFNHIIVS